MPSVQPAAGARVAGAAARSAPVAPPLRVAFCIDNMNVGGTELNAVRTAAHLVRRGVDLRVFSLSTEGPLLDRYAELGVPVHFLPISSLYGWSGCGAAANWRRWSGSTACRWSTPTTSTATSSRARGRASRARRSLPAAGGGRGRTGGCSAGQTAARLRAG
jgi:hypothetical protein